MERPRGCPSLSHLQGLLLSVKIEFGSIKSEGRFSRCNVPIASVVRVSRKYKYQFSLQRNSLA